MNIKTGPLVSIVTPIYNGAEFLSECIESVQAQTYQNWEYTLVDNCSTDRSLEIARAYAARDPRIRIHQNQKYLEVIPNHNEALRQISPASKYCKVVFADDWIFPECLEKMVDVAVKTPSVGLVSAYCLEGNEVICTGLPYSNTCVGGREICRRHLLDNLHLFGSANTLLYRADLVRMRDPFYNEGNIHADNEVCFALLKDCDFGFVHQVLSFTRLRAGSLNTISNDLSTYFAGTLLILESYGRDFLTSEELASCRKAALRDYYQLLAKALFQRRGQKFWDYHRRKLEELGFGFSRTRLMEALLSNLGTAMLQPRLVMEKLRRRQLVVLSGTGTKNIS